MREFETLLILVLAAVILAAAARRVGAPYPVFLAIGGAILAFVPGAPSFTVLPELALALFVAPVLLDAAYDASPRDLRDNWAPVSGLVVCCVGLTTIAVAAMARRLMPEISWAPAIVLGAVVAPPDAATATAVLRQLSDHRQNSSELNLAPTPTTITHAGAAHRGRPRSHVGAPRPSGIGLGKPGAAATIGGLPPNDAMLWLANIPSGQNH
jgi:Kef-type K+ transport system membrane component KefB